MDRRVVVVVDVEGLRVTADHPASLDSRPFPDPDAVADVLEGFGLDVIEVCLVVGDIHVPGPHGTLAARVGRRIIDGLSEVVAQSLVPTRIFDAMVTSWDDQGRFVSELGVDGLLVAASLSYASSIESGALAAEAVIMISPDADAWIAHRYPLGVPIIYAASLDDAEREDISSHHGRWLALSAAALTGMLSEPLERPFAAPLVASHRDPAGPLDAQELAAQGVVSARLDAMKDAATIAVVDVYDLFRNGMAVVGAARLPGPADVRRILTQLRYPESAAVYATFPELHHELLDPAVAGVGGWIQRRAQFSAAAAEYRDDGDPGTSAQLGSLLLEEIGGGRLSVGGQRRISTAVVADAWWAMHSNPTAQVALFSDRWDAVALQLHASSIGLPAPERLVRIGTQPLNLAGSRLPLVVMTDELVADLLRTPTPTGRTQRRTSAAVVTGQLRPRRWRIVDVVPERDAVVLMALDGSSALAHGDALLGVTADGVEGHEIELDHFGWRVEGHGSVIPRLVDDEVDGGEVLHARVIGRLEPTSVVVDLDADNVADIMIGTPGDIETMALGAEVVLATGADGELRYVGPLTDDGGHLEPVIEVVRVTEVDPGVIHGRRRDGTEVVLRPLRGSSLRSDDLVLACPFEGGTWVTFSSQLHHLTWGHA